MVQRAPFLLAALCVAIVGCANREKIAKEELAKDGFTDVELKPGGDGAFEFTATKGGEPCHGSIGINVSFGSTSTFKSSQCGVEHACSQKTPAVCLEQAE